MQEIQGLQGGGDNGLLFGFPDMQHTLCCGVIAGGNLWPGEQAAVECAVDQRLFFFARGLEDVVDDFTAFAGVPDAQAQAPEIGRR